MWQGGGMLIVAVTGGIGSGKSTVSARLAEHGAVLVDSDLSAREVVAPGSSGLAAVVERFGPGVLAVDGSLDRAALAGIVFTDPQARRDLEAITHPRVRELFDRAVAAAAPDAVVVNDIPLLVQVEVAARFHLVVGVGADVEVRVTRLIDRGLTEADARARIASQITDEQRRGLTDIWLDNNGSVDTLLAEVDRLWTERIAVMGQNLTAGRPAPDLPEQVHDEQERARFTELTVARVQRALAGLDVTVLPSEGFPTGAVRIDLLLAEEAEGPTVGGLLAVAGFVAADDLNPGLFSGTDPGTAVLLHLQPMSAR